MTVQNRARQYLASLPAAISGQGGHSATFRAAIVLVQGFNLSEQEALPLILEFNERCQPPWSEEDLRYKLSSAINSPPRKSPGWLLNSGGKTVAERPVQRPAWSPTPRMLPPRKLKDFAFDPVKLASVAARCPGVGTGYLWARSPIRPDGMRPASFLSHLYQPGERVLIFDEMQAKRPANIFTITPPPLDCRFLQEFEAGKAEGVWFLANPVDGVWRALAKGGQSCRSAACVTAFRYALLESDVASPEDWLATLVQMPVPIDAIYTSGGRSIHALWRVDATSKLDWDAKVYRFKGPLKQLGADPGALSAVRLTRLPGCERVEKHGVQTLLYLHPASTACPIMDLPVIHSKS